MFDNDSFIIGQFTEGEPTVSWLGYSDPGVGRRIEAYIAWRWGERPVEWVIKGEGLFIPPLKPVTITAVERFNSMLEPAGEWVPHTQRRTPFGVEFRNNGYYRIQGIAGADTPPPEDVLEACDRLRDYLASIKEDGHPGATTVSDSLPGVALTVRRPTQALARALEYSGAADLLKAYRYV